MYVVTSPGSILTGKVRTARPSPPVEVGRVAHQMSADVQDVEGPVGPARQRVALRPLAAEEVEEPHAPQARASGLSSAAAASSRNQVSAP